MNYHIQGFSSFVYSITKHILEYKYILMILTQAVYLYVSIRLNHCGSSLPLYFFSFEDTVTFTTLYVAWLHIIPIYSLR